MAKIAMMVGGAMLNATRRILPCLKRRGMTKPWKNTKKIMLHTKRRGKSFLIWKMRIDVTMLLLPGTL